MTEFINIPNLKNKMRAHKKLGTSPYLSAIQVHPQLQLRLLPNSCQTLGVSVCVSVCVCVWVFLGWTTSAYPCRTSCHIYPKLCKSKWLLLFFPIFPPDPRFFFAPLDILLPPLGLAPSSTSTPLLLSFEIPARIQRNAAENQQS